MPHDAAVALSVMAAPAAACRYVSSSESDSPPINSDLANAPRHSDSFK